MKKERIRLAGLSIPKELKESFRKMCIVQDLKPYNIIQMIVKDWIAKERKKHGLG